MSLPEKPHEPSPEKIGVKGPASLFKIFSPKRGTTAAFDAVFDAMEAGSAVAAPEKICVSPLELIETENELRLCKPSSFAGPLRFLSWFRWVWLVAVVGFAFLTYRDTFIGKTDEASLMFGVALLSVLLLMGLLGAFVIVPLLKHIFLRIERLQKKQTDAFPVLDLRQRLLVLPARRGAVAWAGLRGFNLGPVTPESWFPLQAQTIDWRTLFLANYPKNKKRKATKHAQALAARSGVLWLGDAQR
jgi:hypothetical protein